MRPQPLWFAAPFGCHAGHVPGRASPRRSPRAPAAGPGARDGDGDGDGNGDDSRGGHVVAALAAAGTAGLGDFSMAGTMRGKNVDVGMGDAAVELEKT